MARTCPKCGSPLNLVNDAETKQPVRIRCTKQQTEKKGESFVETGECDFKINFKTKMYDIDKKAMGDLIDGKEIPIGNNNSMKLDVNEKMFTKINFGEKYSEEAF